MQNFLQGPSFRILFPNWDGISLVKSGKNSSALHGLPVCLCLILWVTATLWGMDCQTRQTNEETILTFRHNAPVAIAHLEAPANSIKIFLKLTGIDPFSPENDPRQWQPPSRSAVRGYRLIPYNKKTLLVIDLLHPVEYQVSETGRGFQVILRDAILRDPVAYAYITGLYEQRHGNLDEALKYYRKVLARRPHHPYAHYKIGQIRLQWEDYREAEVNLKTALDYGCDSVGVYKALAKLYRIYGNSRMAQFYENEYRQQGTPGPMPGKYKNESAPADIGFAAKTGAAPEPSRSSSENVSSSQNATLTRLGANPWIWAAGILSALLFFVTAVRLSFNGFRQKQVARTPGFHKRSIPETGSFAGVVRERIAPTGKAPAPEPNLRRQHRAHIAIQPRKAVVRPAGAGHPPAPEEKSQTSDVEALITALLPNRRMPAENSAADLLERDPGTGNLPAGPEPRTQSGDLREMAQRMNLGVGEIELALKLSALHHQSHRSRDVRQQILALHAQNLSVDEIARKTGLGKGEIELFLRLINSP